MKLDFGEVVENDLNACKHENYCHTYDERLIICKDKSKAQEEWMRKEKKKLNISKFIFQGRQKLWFVLEHLRRYKSAWIATTTIKTLTTQENERWLWGENEKWLRERKREIFFDNEKERDWLID